MIDIDTVDESKLLMKIIKTLDLQCSVLKTTKGIHVYFKGYELTSNMIDRHSPIGVSVTAKLGIKNTFDPLRINGKARRWLRKAKDHEPLPKWLYPMKTKTDHVKQIAEGNRNQELFNYILTLQKETNMSKREIRETIKIINAFVLEDPLSKEEINTVLRDEAFLKESFFSGSTFLHDKFAKFLIQEHHIIQVVNTLHIYKDGVYSDDPADIERAMIQHLPHLSKRQRQEVMAYLQLKAKEKKLDDEKYVAFKNGIYNLDTRTLQELTPDIILKNKLPWNYVENAYYEVTDKTLNKLVKGDKQQRKILEEIFGYILLRRNEFGKAFILTGDGKNGKSSFLKMIRAYVGQENTASLDLKELGQRFKTAELFGKLVNLGDDISGSYIKDNSEFKKLTTGEVINAERKGKDPFDFQNYAKLIFSANKMPKINDTSSGLMRRIMIIPFNATFSPEDKDYDPFIQDKLTSQESMEYMINLGIEALTERLLKNKKFSTSKKVEKEITRYEEENNSVLAFLNTDPKIENEPTNEVYRAYKVFCAEENFDSESKTSFSQYIHQRLGLTSKSKYSSVEKKSIRMYIEDEEE